MTNERYQRGLDTMKKVDATMAERVGVLFEDIAPDFADLCVEFPYGDVLSRPGLDLRTRELVAVAALTMLGTNPNTLKNHIGGALNVGCSRQEIIEVIIQMAVFAGFPKAIGGLVTAKEVFAARSAQE